MTLANMKIGRKLFLGYACVLFGVVLMSATIFVTLKSLVAAAAVNSSSHVVVDELDLMIGAVREQSRTALRYIMTLDDQFAHHYDDWVKSVSQHLARSRAGAEGRAEVLSLLDSVAAAADAYRHDITDQIMDEAKDNARSDEAIELSKSPRAAKAMDAFAAAAADARQRVNAWSSETQDQFDWLMTLLKTTVIAGAASTFLLALLIGWWMTRIIAGPVTSMTGVMKTLAGGDLSVEVPGLGRKDEIGLMADAVQAFKGAAIAKIERDAADAESVKARQKEEEERAARNAEEAHQDQIAIEGLAQGLGRLAGGDLVYRIETPFAPKTTQLRADFNAAVEKLQQAMANIRSTTAGLASGSGEIAMAADDLSRRTEQQAAGLEETAATLDQITATVKNTAAGAVRAQAVASTAKAEADHGGEVVGEAITAMGEIERSSKQIGQIIGVIDEIAFQTNLLALNAGVEAARAGDAGRGFAVVASEVRALAQRSAEAAKEIKGLISASTTHVAQGVDLVGETGKALGRIVAQVAEMNAVVGAIAASAQEQASGLHQVNTAVNQMDQVTQQNAAMVEETTAAAHALGQESDELARLVGLFELGHGGQAGSSAGSAAGPPAAARTAPPGAASRADAPGLEDDRGVGAWRRRSQDADRRR